MIDYHTHTNFSDGTNTPAAMVEEAVRRGITQLAVTDHYDLWDPDHCHKNHNPHALAKHFDEVAACAAGKPLRVYCGVETSTGMDGVLRLPPPVLRLCRLIITSVHYLDYNGPVEKGEYFNDGYWAAYKQKLLAQALGAGHVLGHPEAYLPLRPLLEDGTTFEDRLAICAGISQRYFDGAFIDALGDALVQSGKAYELHGVSGTPRQWVVHRLHAKGVRFSIGSDAHSLSKLGCNAQAMDMWREYGLKVLELDP